MRVEITTPMAGVLGVLEPGRIVDVEKKQADRLIEKGYARKAETATRKAPERATKGRK